MENVFEHFIKKCNCIHKNKICNLSGKIDIEKFNNIDYISFLYEEGILDGLYNIIQSITQTLRNRNGLSFEKIIE